MARPLRCLARMGLRCDGRNHLRHRPPPCPARLIIVGERATTMEQIGWYCGIIFSIFLIGWAIGGNTFGILADRFGRTKVLIAIIILPSSREPLHYRRPGGTSPSIDSLRRLASGVNGWPAQRSSRKPGRKKDGQKLQGFSNPPGLSGSIWPPHSTLRLKKRTGGGGFFSSASCPHLWPYSFAGG
jgi:hypothetical protein